MMILMLDEAIAISAASGTREAVIGMAHRGRLNVLAHVLHRTYASILAEFEGRPASEVAEELPEGGFGDVKYHHGAHSTREMSVPIIGDDGIERLEKRTIALSLMPNPSHLEFVNPVVAGKVRALQTDHSRSLAPLDRSAALSITIHGDAAFPGQGIVAETLNLQSLDGYSVGGTLHLIANNQVGFTTDPEDERSTQHSSDLAKGFDIPIIHVNADDIEACRTATRLAMAFRERFERDVLIDLVGYRRWGHNEGDEPSYTQPQLYERIAAHPPVAELYAGRLIVEGVVTEDDVAEIRSRVRARVAEAHAAVRAGTEEHTREGWKKKPRDLPDRPPPDAAELTELNETLLAVPEGFTVHPKLANQLERRRAALVDGRHRLGPRGGARVRLAPARRRADPAHGPGLRARHVRPPPCRPARRAHGRDVRAHAARAGRTGELRGAQLAALGERVPRVRVRLLDHRVRRARDLGGAVRRLRERRTGGHRPVHRVRPLEVGPDLPARAVPAARLRGQRARAQLGAARALPAARRR